MVILISIGALCVIVAVLKDGELKEYEHWEVPGVASLLFCLFVAFVPAGILNRVLPELLLLWLVLGVPCLPRNMAATTI